MAVQGQAEFTFTVAAGESEAIILNDVFDRPVLNKQFTFTVDSITDSTTWELFDNKLQSKLIDLDDSDNAQSPAFDEFNFGHGRLLIKNTTSGTDGALTCLLYTSPSPRDRQKSRMPSSA